MNKMYEKAIEPTCNAFRLSAINSGCIFPMIFLGGKGKLLMQRAELRIANSLYLLDTFQQFDLTDPL